MNEQELLRTVCRYVLSMYGQQRYSELKHRLEVLIELIDMTEATSREYMVRDIVETVCFTGEDESNDAGV